MIEPAWKRRYRAPRTGFPTWARDRADLVVYLSNHTNFRRSAAAAASVKRDTP